MSTKAIISSLHVYPIKSCLGVSPQQVVVGSRGPDLDRRWMIVDATGRFMSIRSTPKMIFIKTDWDGDNLHVRIPGQIEHKISLKAAGSGKLHEVTVWNDTCLAVDQGDSIANALSQFLQTDCRLVFMPDTTHRLVKAEYAVQPTDVVGFADAYPFLLISEASLEELNSRLEQPIPMNRFRPNFVVSGCKPFEEDTWKSIQIGEVSFEMVKLCSRCVAITVDQATGEKNPEPMKTLIDYRMQDKKVMFGVNLVQTSLGKIRIGDEVEILKSN